MLITHRFELAAKCPSDSLGDLYQVTIETERLVLVEDILSFIEETAKETLYQENLALRLARKFNVRVTLEGIHFGKVRTTVQAP